MAKYSQVMVPNPNSHRASSVPLAIHMASSYLPVLFATWFTMSSSFNRPVKALAVSVIVKSEHWHGSSVFGCRNMQGSRLLKLWECSFRG